MNLADKAARVRSRVDLADFIAELCRDLRTNPEAWQNDKLEAFLAAMSAWVEDLEGYYENRGQPVPETPTWKTFAEMLAASKVYE